MNQPLQMPGVEGAAPALLTVEDFMAVVEAVPSLTDQAGKLELIDGIMVKMSPANNHHFLYQRQLFLKLHAIFGDGLNGYIAGQEPTFRLDDYNACDPDIAIMKLPEPGSFLNRPGDMILAVEVSDTTLAKDKGIKKRKYAAAGIAAYWVVDVKGKQVLVHAEPRDGDYLSLKTIPFGTPIGVPGSDAELTIETCGE